MKLKQSHIFYLLLAILLLSCLGTNIKEGLENNEQKNTEKSGEKGNEAWYNDKGLPKSQVPKGEEDLYILKSKIVPPVCPKCPDINVCPDKGKNCPPCPPCGRCPEPAFKCQKVPDLKSSNTSYLPQPILTDFSQFSV